MKVNFSPEHKRLIKSRIRDYKKYDLKRWGTEAQLTNPTITYEEYLELVIEQSGKCHWTGRDMSIDGNKTTEASLDRLHCHLPHTKDNCVLVQRAMNLGRNDSSILDWVTYLNDMGILRPELAAELEAYNQTH